MKNNACADIGPVLLACCVKDLWKPSGGSNWQAFSNLLPSTIPLQFASVSITNGGDSIYWAKNSDGNYSVRSGYIAIQGWLDLQGADKGFYKRIWKLRVLERVRYFIWLSKGGILTNLERNCKHLGNSSTCPCCNVTDESLLHLFRTILLSNFSGCRLKM